MPETTHPFNRLSWQARTFLFVHFGSTVVLAIVIGLVFYGVFDPSPDFDAWWPVIVGCVIAIPIPTLPWAIQDEAKDRLFRLFALDMLLLIASPGVGCGMIILLPLAILAKELLRIRFRLRQGLEHRDDHVQRTFSLKTLFLVVSFACLFLGVARLVGSAMDDVLRDILIFGGLWIGTAFVLNVGLLRPNFIPNALFLAVLVAFALLVAWIVGPNELPAVMSGVVAFVIYGGLQTALLRVLKFRLIQVHRPPPEPVKPPRRRLTAEAVHWDDFV